MPKRNARGVTCPHINKRRVQDPEAALKVLQADFGVQNSGAGVQCLVCGVASPTLAKHKASHRGKKAHDIVIDLDCGELYCTVCKDFVYDVDLDSAVRGMHAARLAVCQDAPTSTCDDSPLGSPVAAVEYIEIDDVGTPSADELSQGPATAALSDGCTTAGGAFASLPPGDGFPSGLRGLNNMGHTCFMNSILQAMLHSPLLSGHYLMHGHTRQGCPVSAGGGHCVSCQLDGVFSAAYSGQRSPHSPAAFLHAWWMLAGSALGGYKQQDAHEFFLFILEMLAATAGRDNVASRVFGGSLRSDVICSACGHTSTTLDHFTNLSLDIPPPATVLPPPILPRVNQSSMNGKAVAATGKGSKVLVGAAKLAHLRRVQREQAGGRRQAEPTPERSSDGVDTCMQHSDDITEESGVAAAAAGHPPRPSPPPQAAASGVERSETRGASIEASEEEGQDTLSSPRRARALEPSPSPGGYGAAESAQNGAAGSAGLNGVASDAALAHPALTGYLRWPGVSLLGSLRRFVRAERLGAGEQRTCEACHAQQHAVKQLSLLRLPPVLVLHAKRFEHGGGARAAARKLDTYISFPLEGLDMAPYLSSTLLRARHSLRQPAPHPPAAAAQRAAEAAPTPAGAAPHLSSPLTRSASAAATTTSGGQGCSGASRPASAQFSAAAWMDLSAGADHRGDFLYDLFAVVCHRGTFQGGHYVCYVRCADGGWYLCDDAYVAPVDADTVRNCQAYMLFYGQRALLPFRDVEAR